MEKQYNLDRFLKAQDYTYDIALQEVKNGSKNGHWMWYIFPQIDGLGYSETTNFYAIRDIEEATQYYEHPILGQRLVNISKELMNLKHLNPVSIFGYVDSLKLKSSMTLFSLVRNSDPVFRRVLKQYYNGNNDLLTINILNSSSNG